MAGYIYGVLRTPCIVKYCIYSVPCLAYIPHPPDSARDRDHTIGAPLRAPGDLVHRTTPIHLYTYLTSADVLCCTLSPKYLT